MQHAVYTSTTMRCSSSYLCTTLYWYSDPYTIVTYTYTHIHTYTHTHIHTYTHTHIRTYAHTHICAQCAHMRALLFCFDSIHHNVLRILKSCLTINRRGDQYTYTHIHEHTHTHAHAHIFLFSLDVNQYNVLLVLIFSYDTIQV